MHVKLVSFVFSLFFISVVTTKVLRLCLNEHSFGVVGFLFYLPIFLLSDLALLCLEWVLLRPTGGILAVLGFAVAFITSVVTFLAAAGQFSFWIETGGEVDWADTIAFLLDSEGRKVLMSGGGCAMYIAIALVITAWVLKRFSWAVIGAVVGFIRSEVLFAYRWTSKLWRRPENVDRWGEEGTLVDSEAGSVKTDEGYDSDTYSDEFNAVKRDYPSSYSYSSNQRISRRGIAIFVVSLYLGSTYVFGTNLPFSRTMTTLPLPLLDVLRPEAIMCYSGTWPMPDQITKEKWEKPRGNFKGWAPGSVNQYSERYKNRNPSWVPQYLPDGFARWDPVARRQAALDNATPTMTGLATPTSTPSLRGSKDKKTHCPKAAVTDPFYNPVSDPLKISNLANDVLQPIRSVLKSGSVNIKNVALILVESMREELWPLQQDSEFHKVLMKAHKQADFDEINARFAQMGVNAEMITGKSGNFKNSTSGEVYKAVSQEWKNPTPEGFGGINIVGAETTASVSFKSMAAIYCGTWPLPVDMFEEVEWEIYQPCMTQIMQLFNEMKSPSNKANAPSHWTKPQHKEEDYDDEDDEDYEDEEEDNEEEQDEHKEEEQQEQKEEEQKEPQEEEHKENNEEHGEQHDEHQDENKEDEQEKEDEPAKKKRSLTKKRSLKKKRSSNSKRSLLGGGAAAAPASENYRSHQWRTAFFQSITDGFERQDKFNDRIGFDHIVTKKFLDDQAPPGHPLEDLNYFGYEERLLAPHIRSYIESSKANHQRMFMTHFTSTTHHPWATPDYFNTTDYMEGSGGHFSDTHGDMNRYLNTIRYTDAWLGELMQMFQDTGIADETLVVIVGDHGQAFNEDYKKTGTYSNSHISNFRVPITFRHPRIPRVQHEVAATSVSILPTILDLLVTSGSLDDRDTAAASDILHDYEGQSLIRTYVPNHDGRRAWNFGLVNPGGEMLTMTSADAPWRFILPLEGDGDTEYVFSDLASDPLELKRVAEWSFDGLVRRVTKKFGDEATEWLKEAKMVGEWWTMERKRLYQYENE